MSLSCSSARRPHRHPAPVFVPASQRGPHHTLRTRCRLSSGFWRTRLVRMDKGGPDRCDTGGGGRLWDLSLARLSSDRWRDGRSDLSLSQRQTKKAGGRNEADIRDHVCMRGVSCFAQWRNAGQSTGGLLVPEMLRRLHEEGDHQCGPLQQGVREEVYQSVI
jgi:hypothetical protein